MLASGCVYLLLNYIPTWCFFKIKVELDLSDYATKSDLENAAGVDTSTFAKKANLASLKSKYW